LTHPTPKEIKCPKCGSETVLRTAKKGQNAGEKYFVCINYPNCKGKVRATNDQIRDKKTLEATEAIEVIETKGGWPEGGWLYDVDFYKSISTEQDRARKIVRERMDIPDIDDRKFMLLQLDFLSLTNIFNTQGAKWDLALSEHAALMREEDLSEGPNEPLQEWRKAFERRKAQLREDIEKNREEVREIVARSQE